MKRILAAVLWVVVCTTQTAGADTCSTQGIAPGGCIVKKSIPASEIPDPAQLLEKMKRAYEALGSYADTGVMILEERPIGATLIREQHSFTTHYQAPRQFLFDFRKGATGERFVIWCPSETFNSWWSSTQVAEAYPKGEGANAFAVGALPTSGAALLIPPLLFQKAGLQGPLLQMTQLQYGGKKQLDGRLTYIVTGFVPVNHWGDNARATTVWIDAETMMIRKVFEDTPTGMGGAIQRVTTTFSPQPNAKLDNSRFRFQPPRPQ